MKGMRPSRHLFESKLPPPIHTKIHTLPFTTRPFTSSPTPSSNRCFKDERNDERSTHKHTPPHPPHQAHTRTHRLPSSVRPATSFISPCSSSLAPILIYLSNKQWVISENSHVNIPPILPIPIPISIAITIPIHIPLPMPMMLRPPMMMVVLRRHRLSRRRECKPCA